MTRRFMTVCLLSCFSLFRHKFLSNYLPNGLLCLKVFVGIFTYGYNIAKIRQNTVNLADICNFVMAFVTMTSVFSTITQGE